MTWWSMVFSSVTMGHWYQLIDYILLSLLHWNQLQCKVGCLFIILHFVC